MHQYGSDLAALLCCQHSLVLPILKELIHKKQQLE